MKVHPNQAEQLRTPFMENERAGRRLGALKKGVVVANEKETPGKCTGTQGHESHGDLGDQCDSGTDAKKRG